MSLLMSKLAACYSQQYFAETPTASMRKLPIVAREVEAKGLAELLDPGSLDPSILLRLHAPEYVHSFLTGRGKLASSQGWGWTTQIRDGVIAIALVAQEHPELKVGILDADQHQGNGTADFTTRLPNLYNYTIYGTTFGAPDYPRSINRPLRSCTNNFDLYAQVVQEGLNQMLQWAVDIIIYQAGADPHVNDPYGSLGLTTEQLRLRDRQVFQFAKNHGIPVLFVLAGGYQEPIETLLAPLHVATFEEASDIFASSS
jgi:acetoin utilization deacetylase AcuC-like enzyme